MKTIPELLASKMYRFNQTFLTKELGINRGTLRKYMKDEKGEFHQVIKINGEMQLFTNQTRKISDER